MSDASPPPPAGAPARPKLKLSVSSSRPASFSEAKAPQSATTPSASTPKIRIKSAQTPTAAEQQTPVSAKTKAGRQPKPTSRLIESKKRGQASDDEDDEPLSKRQQPSEKRIKLLKTPLSATARAGLILKSRGKPPYHPPGEGYDSEESDREIDPTIEEQFVLRLMPGEHCDYLRKCLDEGKIGVKPSQGGADFSIKWLTDESRRAIVNVKGQSFAAVMLELPTVTEGMKSWDRKSFMKAADLCHMLLVFQKVSSEEEAKKVPLPPMIQPDYKWPHGLTPPMHDAVNQRFAKTTISRSEVERKQAEVKKLIDADRASVKSRFEWVDDRPARSDGEDYDEDMLFDEDEEDADGEADESGYFPSGGYENGEMVEDGEGHAADLEAELEAALFEDAMEGGTPATQADGATPGTMAGATPAAGAQESGADAEEEGEDGESVVSDEDDSDESGDDNEEQTRIKGVKQDIANLKKSIAQAEKELEQHASNKILRRRVEMRLKSLKSELEVKMSSIEEEEDEDEE